MAKRDYRKKDEVQDARTNGKRNSGAKSKRGNRGSNNNRTSVSHNTALGTFTSQLKGSTSIMFPEASLSMTAMGNPISSPGQDNFIESWNTIFRQSIAPGNPTMDFTTGFARHTPNAACIDVCPYFGATASITDWSTVSDPLQIAATNLKQFIDTSFGTVTSYDSQDLMLYLMGVQAVYPLIAEIKRDLRLAVTYQTDVWPQYIPRGLFALLKISDLDDHYENGEGAAYTAKFLRSWTDEFNQIIFSFNKLPVPPEMAIFRYNDDLWDYIYMDTPDEKTAQLYIFRLSDLWSYEEHAEPYPILSISAMNYPMTVGAKIEKLRTMVNALTALQTSSTAMIQNLYNAYGSKDLIKVETLDAGSILPMEMKYDEDMLISIDNMAIMDRDAVRITNICANPTDNRCEGHVYLTGMSGAALKSIVNIPLQFHKPFSMVTKDEIGRALRFHPTLRVWKDFNEYTGSTVNRVTGLTADGYTGFIIPRKVTIAVLGTHGEFDEYKAIPATGDWVYPAMDFTHFPAAISANISGEHVDVRGYMARRDVEVTYRLEDLRMFWTYMTCILYGSDLNRNFIGTRLK